jgi:hypothetical protein
VCGCTLVLCLSELNAQVPFKSGVVQSRRTFLLSEHTNIQHLGGGEREMTHSMNKKTAVKALTIQIVT